MEMIFIHNAMLDDIALSTCYKKSGFEHLIYYITIYKKITVVIVEL